MKPTLPLTILSSTLGALSKRDKPVKDIALAALIGGGIGFRTGRGLERVRQEPTFNKYEEKQIDDVIQLLKR